MKCLFIFFFISAAVKFSEQVYAVASRSYPIHHDLMELPRTKQLYQTLPLETTTVQSLPYNLQKLGNFTSIRQLLMETAISPMKVIGPIARNTVQSNIAQLPCCRDRFGEQACQSLRKSQPAFFEKRCLSDHDFSSIDCCGECRKYMERNNISVENAKTVQKAPTVCKDKHSIAFCRRFKASGMGKYSCADAEFAVRVCRHSCGYCNDELYLAKNAPVLCSEAIKLNNLPFWQANRWQ